MLNPDALAIVPYIGAAPVIPAVDAAQQEQLQIVVLQPGDEEQQQRAGEQATHRTHRPANASRYLNITTAALSLGPAIYWYTHNPLLTSAAVLTLLSGFYLGQQCPSGVYEFAATVLRGSAENTRTFVGASKMTLKGVATATILALKQLNQRNMQRLGAITRFSINVIRQLMRPNIIFTAIAAGSAYMLRNLYHAVIEMIQSFDLEALLALNITEGELIAIGALTFSAVALFAHNFLGGEHYVVRQRTNVERAIEARLNQAEHALNIPLARPRQGLAPGQLPVFNAQLENLERMFERPLDAPEPVLVVDHGIMYRTSRIALYSMFNLTSTVAGAGVRLTGRVVSAGIMGAGRVASAAGRALTRGTDTIQGIAARTVEGVGVVTGGVGALAGAAIALTAAVIALPFAGTAAAGYYHPKILGTIILSLWAYIMLYNYLYNIN